jgi:hypothetical protein
MDMSLGERRGALAGARRALAGLESRLWEAGGAELAELLGEVDRVVSAGEAARVSVVAEAIDRGEPGAGERALSPVDWVREHAPSLRAGGAGQVVRVAGVFAVPGTVAVKEAVVSGRLPVAMASVVASEAQRMRPLLAEGAEPAVVEGLIEMAASHGSRGCRGLRPALLARYGLDDVLDRESVAAKQFVGLSQPVVGELGVAEYRLALDPEARAVMEAAVGPLSAPVPVDGERDLRSTEQRRGEALVTLVRRAVAGAESVPTAAKCQLFVSVDLETLRSGSSRSAAPAAPPAPDQSDALDGVLNDDGVPVGPLAAGEVVGSLEAGTLLAPSVVRRLACDSAVIPVVLGSGGEVADLGCSVRLFTPGQVRRLWLRDGSCTFPGCSIPAHWCDAHHLVHWVDGGPTDLDNAALLCGRHHTVVHDRRLVGTVGSVGVAWDVGYGSYDRALAGLAAADPA